jgi:hypothetical protein
VGSIVEHIVSVFPRPRLVVAIQLYERFDRSSISELARSFDSCAITIYGIDAPGRNHGLALLSRVA